MSKTSIVLFPEAADSSAPKGQKTAVCIGAPRGGTSMVAGAMVGLGIFMGRDLPVNIEDPEFNADLHAGDLQRFIRDLPKTIEKRNAENDVWGFKYPRAVRYMEKVHKHLRNLHLVVVLRDPIPASLRSLKKSRHTPLDVVKENIRTQNRNMRLAETLNVPTLLVSYERAVANPADFIAEMAAFLDVPMPADIGPILAFMEPGEYKLPPQVGG